MKNHYRTNIFVTLILFTFIFLSTSLKAQLSAWQYQDVISIFDHSGSAQSNYPVLLKLNTKKLIDEGKMKSDGGDMRFSATCTGTTLLDYYIESGINTENTLVWVRIPALPANGVSTIILFYGNAGASSAGDVNKVFVTKRIVSRDMVLLADSGDWKYDLVEIKAGASLTLGPNYGKPFRIIARKLLINGNLIGDAGGYLGGNTANGQGPGGGKVNTSTSGGGGASFGGIGGMGAFCCDKPETRGMPGEIYGTEKGFDVDMGSGGAGAKSIYSNYSLGGNGGALLYLSAGLVEINAKISANGGAGMTGYQGSAGGSGGMIFVSSAVLKISSAATISTNGGAGGNADAGLAGAGGGGGRIKLFSSYSIDKSGALESKGGVKGNGGSGPATKGENGTIFVDSVNSLEATIVVANGLDPAIKLNPNKTITCEGKIINVATLYSNGGDAPIFEWYKNSEVLNVENSPKIELSDLKDGDKLFCKMTSNSTCIGASPIAYSDTIQFTILPALIASYSSNPDSGSNTGQKVYFTCTTATADSFIWNFGDGSPIETGKKVNHIYATEGFFNVQLITINANCVDTLNREHEVNDNITFGVHDKLNSNNFFFIFPNPSSGELQIKSNMNDSKIEWISILDIAGREVYSTKNNLRRLDVIPLDLTNLNQGIYIVRIGSADKVFAKPLIMNR